MILLLLCMQVDSVTLHEVIDLALTQSPEYHESKTTLDKSRIFFYQTLSSMLPTVSASVRYTKSEYQDVETDIYNSAFNLNQPLFDLDILSSIVAAKRSLKASNTQHKSEVASLVLKLKISYYNLINARELLNSSEIAIQRAEENLKLIEAKFELGAASRLEVLQGEVFWLRALQDQARARTLFITAQSELQSMLDIRDEIYPLDSLVKPDSILIPSLDSLARILDKANYAIDIARELKNVAHLDLVASYLAFLPKISFFYGYTYSDDSLVFDFQHIKDNASKDYGISVSLPIFEIKSLIFKHANARKEYQKQQFSQRKVLLETEKSLRTTYYGFREAYEQLRFADKSVVAATEATTIAREQYELGVISFLDFLTAEKDFYESRVSYISALSDFYTNRANLSYLLGEREF